MDYSRTRSRRNAAARSTSAVPVPMPEPKPAPFALKSASLHIMSVLPSPSSLPSPTSSPGTQCQADLDLDATLQDSLFSLSFPVDGPSAAVAAAAATKLPPPPASPTTSTNRVLAAFSAAFPPAALYGGAAHIYHQHRTMPISQAPPHYHHQPHGTLIDQHSPFSTLHLPPSPAPSESSAYTSSFPDVDCHSPKATVPSPTLTTAADPELQQPHIDLTSIAAFLNLPADLTQLARSALDAYVLASRLRFSNNQLIAAAIICAARALNVNLSMCDTVKACGLSSVNQVRPVVSDLRRRSEVLVALESESDSESASPRTSGVPEFVGVEVPLTPLSQEQGPEPSPWRRLTRAGSTPCRPASPSKPAASHSLSFSRLTPAIVSALSLPPEAHEHIEHVFHTSRQQIKLRRGIKGGMCGDDSILGGAIYFVGKRLGMYPVSQAKVAEAVGRTPTTVKGMFDRMCGMGDVVVPSELRDE